MTLTADQARQAAICQLLQIPNPPELTPVGHVRTEEGCPLRFQHYQYLGQEFVARQQIARMNEREV